MIPPPIMVQMLNVLGYLQIERPPLFSLFLFLSLLHIGLHTPLPHSYIHLPDCS